MWNTRDLTIHISWYPFKITDVMHNGISLKKKKFLKWVLHGQNDIYNLLRYE